MTAADRIAVVDHLDAALNELDEAVQSGALPSQDDRLADLLRLRKELNALANRLEAA